jgi:uncharacterized membrane-anchored protein
MPHAILLAFFFVGKKKEKKVPLLVDIALSIMAHISSTLNPFIYMILNPGFVESVAIFKKKYINVVVSWRSSETMMSTSEINSEQDDNIDCLSRA